MKRVIEQGLPPQGPIHDQATLDLLAQWDAEDQTSDPAEIQRPIQEWEQFRRSMDENSLSGRRIYP